MTLFLGNLIKVAVFFFLFFFFQRSNRILAICEGEAYGLKLLCDVLFYSSRSLSDRIEEFAYQESVCVDSDRNLCYQWSSNRMKLIKHHECVRRQSRPSMITFQNNY